MGHEFVGEIIDVGFDVKNFKKGDKIIVPFSTSCGNCFYCAKALTSRCEKAQVFGTHSLDGGQAEYVRIPFADTTGFLAPKEISDDLAFLMADIFPTGYFAAKNAWTLLSDQERQDPNLIVCVIGCGPVGLCAITAACDRFPIVYAIDSVEERLDEAKKHGAIPINLNNDPVSVIKNVTEGRGADAILEVVGHADALQLAYDLIRPWGVIASVGAHQDAFPFSGPQVYDKNVRLQFGRCPVRALFPEALRLFSKKQDQFKTFVSHRMSLSDAAKAYELFDKRLARKVIFDLRT
ncbi:unnamed protein product [Rotaria sordida]|uniref:Alcohol dehydrogenase n=1 Tax=Rotaria sordida TaxID=392033 RepID=A0A813QMH9_9BILA|nr:unnamed protein product [Rotaria sordida]CAF0816573.1 unnamed protein product [Rotaria sordida]